MDDNGPRDEPRHPAQTIHIWQVQAVRDVLLVVVLLGILWLGYLMRDVTVPLLVALALAYLFEPLVSRLTRSGAVGRPLVVSGIIACVSIVFLVIAAFTVPLVVGQSIGLVKSIEQGAYLKYADNIAERLPPEYRSDYDEAITWLRGTLEGEASEQAIPGQSLSPDTEDTSTQRTEAPPAHATPLDAEDIRAIVNEEMARHPMDVSGSDSSLISFVGSGVEKVLGFLLGLVELGFLAFLIPFYFFFFSVSFPKVVQFIDELIPDNHRDRIGHLVGEMDKAVAGFVRGRIVISAIMGVLLAIGWMICGVPYAIALGLLIGVFCAIPYLGIIGVPIAVGLLGLEQLGIAQDSRMAWWAIILWPTLVFCIVQAIEGYILTPLIAGKVTNLSPVTIFVAVLAGGSLAGIYGMLLAIPVAACIKIVLKEVVAPRIDMWRRGEVSDPLPLEG